MTAEQRDAAMALLATVLSAQGLEKVNLIEQADDVFKDGAARNGPRGGRGRPGGPPGGGPPPGVGSQGGPTARARRPWAVEPRRSVWRHLYFISFLGEPSTTAPWMLQCGGHHLALNITIAGTAGVLTPTLTGAQPAMFEVQDRTLRPLGRRGTKPWRCAIAQRGAAQRRRAELSRARSRPRTGSRWQEIQPEGLKVASMTDAQRPSARPQGESIGIMNDAHAAPGWRS